ACFLPDRFPFFARKKLRFRPRSVESGLRCTSPVPPEKQPPVPGSIFEYSPSDLFHDPMLIRERFHPDSRWPQIVRPLRKILLVAVSLIPDLRTWFDNLRWRASSAPQDRAAAEPGCWLHPDRFSSRTSRALGCRCICKYHPDRRKAG